MKQFIIAILLLLVGLTAYAANNPTDAVSWYKFESGALTTDSQGSNTLFMTGTVDANTADYQEGAASAFFSGGSNYFTQADLDIFADGDSNDFTVTCWVLPRDTAATRTIWEQYDIAGDQRGFKVQHDASGNIVAYAGYNGGAEYDTYNPSGITLADDTWSFLAVTFTDVNDGYTFYEYDGSAHWADGVLDEPIHHSTDDFQIGVAGTIQLFNGCIDEMIIWNKTLTRDELDQVRQGTYGAADESSGDLVIVLK